jgi:rRNA large subunit m3Psi methyltransferase RlmH
MHCLSDFFSELNFNLTTPEEQKRRGKNSVQIKQLEGELLMKAGATANLIIAFDEHGKQHTTKEFAQAMQNWQQNGDSVALLIGGADGLSNTIKHKFAVALAFINNSPSSCLICSIFLPLRFCASGVVKLKLSSRGNCF